MIATPQNLIKRSMSSIAKSNESNNNNLFGESVAVGRKKIPCNSNHNIYGIRSTAALGRQICIECAHRMETRKTTHGKIYRRITMNQSPINLSGNCQFPALLLRLLGLVEIENKRRSPADDVLY